MPGVPIADVDRFHEWSNVIFADWNRSRDKIDEAYTAMSRYMSELITQKRQVSGDDLISVLVDARDSAGKLTEDELVQFCIGLLAAGHETTANSINMSFVALCQHPDELARLRADPGLIPAAVEELLRYVIISGSGFVPLARVTREEVRLGGVTIPAGKPSCRRSTSPTETPRRLTIRTGLTWDARPRSTWASGRAPITASARSSPGWSCRRPSAGCWPGCPACE